MAVMTIPARAPAGERLRRARELRGWSQWGLVDEVQQFGGQIARSTIARIETNRVDPDLDTVWLLAKVLRIDPQWLAGFTDDEPVLEHTA